MGRYAIVNDSTGTVENVIVWDGVTSYPPPDGCSLIEVQEGEMAEPGGSFQANPRAFERAPRLEEEA